MSPMPDRTWSFSMTISSAPSMRTIRGAGAGTPDGRARQLGLTLEERGETLARLFDGALVGRRDVDRNAEVHARLAGVSRFTPRLPVRRELGLEIRDLGRAQADEDRQSHLPGQRKGLVARRRHADRWMGDLIGPRRDDGVLHAIELALVAERLGRPSAADDLQRLAEARLALGVRHAVNVVRAHDAAAPDAELEAPFADVIDGGDLFGDAQRMIQR